MIAGLKALEQRPGSKFRSEILKVSDSLCIDTNVVDNYLADDETPRRGPDGESPKISITVRPDTIRFDHYVGKEISPEVLQDSSDSAKILYQLTLEAAKQRIIDPKKGRS